MKTHLLVPVWLAITVASLQASPLWTSNRDSEYLLSSDNDLSSLSIGLTLERNDRELTYKRTSGHQNTDLFQFQRYKGYLGFDLFSWLTVYGIGGGCRIAVGDNMEGKQFEDGNTEYGAGLRLNILDHIILDPLVIEDKIRLTATFQYTRSSFDYESIRQTFDWYERLSVVQLSIVNDVEGNPWFCPESVAINVGIVYSDVEGDYGLNEVDGGWMTLGLEMFYSKRISFDVSKAFSNSNETRGMTAGFHLRF